MTGGGVATKLTIFLFLSEWGPPSAMDNTPLLQYSSVGGKGAGPAEEEEVCLVKGAPYRKVSREVWDLFQRAYGGGPVVVTSLEPISNTQEK